MMGLLWETSFGAFLVLTVLLGGGGAWMTGRAIARGWSPLPHLVVYMALLACGIRFLQFALFQGTLLSIHYWIVTFVIYLIVGFAGWRHKRTGQMTTQYRWIYERTGPFTWRERAGT
ncbi:hypothetical protein F0357_04255 [Rhizobiales bacterium Sp-1]|uniref:DUF6867 domain-containing protein n=2 Tax=Segnochrobactrum spirostomi TaxID=2608987 RepID=A0A6A7XZX2_9HYPH|nr:hypothetical protein [Segnochrobactrum spirostomi]